MMAKHTDFGRLGRGGQAAPTRRKDARAALFTEQPETLPVDAAEDVAPAHRAEPAVVATAPAPEVPDQPPSGALDAGWFVLDCSACHTPSRMGLLALMFAAVPSVHVPFLRPDYPSLMRCPRCHAYRWVNVRFDLDL
ncbi:hypothetical protein [Cumulibacter manganitolerans]|uniref:hypothetical protein n=1 Tax=Cumulibacter manganitolerans TaxID=1884992 RepID=UPI001294ECC2|nr:hypothetical protein [Cumulibacter manganitolerans]